MNPKEKVAKTQDVKENIRRYRPGSGQDTVSLAFSGLSTAHGTNVISLWSRSQSSNAKLGMRQKWKQPG